MKVELDLRDLAQFPFLKESQDFIGNLTGTLDEFISGAEGGAALSRAVERVKAALPRREGDAIPAPPTFPVDAAKIRTEIASYALARVLVSCAQDRFLIDRLSRYEASRALAFLQAREDGEGRGEREKRQRLRAYVGHSLDFDPDGREVAVIEYVELACLLRDQKWRLVNRSIIRGRVQIDPGEGDALLRERIRVVLVRSLPLPVPKQVCTALSREVEGISVAYQEAMLQEFGAVEEVAFPPCIQALMGAITKGTNLPHTARFAMTAFFHTIGMSVTGIVELYCRAPDFDVTKTMYQVEHITGRGGTEYTPPSCATMRTYGLCSGRDALCEKVSHPLSYYRMRKKSAEKKPEPPNAPSG
ncbi:MAG: DNA primase large subunit PriL [Methanomicrobiales archaeon]|nr:DNA primase large subunit PriL [Methanomicrobiales archaeon]